MLSGTLGSLGLDDLVGFLSTHGVEGVLTLCGAASSLHLLFVPGRLVVPQARPGRLSPEALDALLARARRVQGARAPRLSRAALDALHARARALRAPDSTAPDSTTGRPGRTGHTTGSLRRSTLEALLARADAIRDADHEARRHRVAEQVHAVSASGRARFEFTPCVVPPDLLRDIEAGGGVALEPLALLMEVARLTDERTRRPSSAPTRAARRPATGARPGASVETPTLQGDIDGVGLAALLQTLRERRRGGTLTLLAGGREERLYFVEGEAFALRIEADDEFAFALLGVDAADSVRALVRGAAIDEGALTEAEQARLRERFLEVLFAEGATFAFHEGDLPPDVRAPRRGVTRISLQTERFLLQAIQRWSEWDALRDALDDGRAVLRFVSPGAKLEAIRAGGLPEVLTLLDGRLRFDEAVKAARAPRLVAARAVADLLRAGRLVAV